MKFSRVTSSVLLGVVIATFVVTVGYGLYLSGSPTVVRMQRADQMRVDNLNQISYAIDGYWGQHRQLPTNLHVFNQTDYGYVSSQLLDPVTKKPYEYETISTNSYKLCADFQTIADTSVTKMYPQPIGPSYDPHYWEHKAGRDCYTFVVRKQPPL